jgi:predicted O-methyltransferase YrrM
MAAMKDRSDAILRPEQARYLDALLPPRDALLAEMEAYAAAHQVPISDPEVGRLLALLARSRGARRILEVGTAIGYGAIWLARGAPEAHVVTLEADAATAAVARGYLERAGVLSRVEVIEGAALDVLYRLDGPFDLVYLDADKTEYRRCLDLALPMIPVGGRILVDNLLWQGRIADPSLRPEGDRVADAVERFNPYFLIHPQLAASILPVGDGVGFAVKRRETIRELGGPF